MPRVRSEKAWINADLGKIKLCPQCGAPEEITKYHLWLNSGVIVQSTNMSRRICYIESENLDPLYQGMGKISGTSIEGYIIDIVRQGAADYFESLIPQEIRDMLRNGVLGLNFVTDFLVTIGHLNGNGRYELVDMRYEGNRDDYATVRITEPFSPVLAAGVNAGASEIITGKPHEATYKEISPGVYEITSYLSERRGELEKRAQTSQYHHRDGDIELEKCAACGGPAALSDLKWHLNRGVVMNNRTAKRVVLIGLEIQDSLFEGLRKELGEDIPQAVVEAQRRFVKSGFYSMEKIGSEADFRTQLALRGMGNLREMKISSNGMRIRIDNAANYLMATGLFQGVFEMAFDTQSQVEWEVSQEGDLSVEVTPKK